MAKSGPSAPLANKERLRDIKSDFALLKAKLNETDHPSEKAKIKEQMAEKVGSLVKEFPEEAKALLGQSGWDIDVLNHVCANFETYQVDSAQEKTKWAQLFASVKDVRISHVIDKFGLDKPNQLKIAHTAAANDPDFAQHFKNYGVENWSDRFELERGPSLLILRIQVPI